VNPLDLARVAIGLTRALRSQYWSAERIRAWQEPRLVAMMRHAATHVRFYREHGIDPGSITSSADLERFPIITKSDIQRAGRGLLADGLDAGRLPFSRTSGSSGEPTTTWFDRAAWLQTRYVLKLRRLLVNSGPRPGQRVLIVSEARPEDIAALDEAAPAGGPLYRRKLISIHAPFEAHVEEIVRFRPTALYAYPSYLAELVDTARRMAQPLPPIPLVYTSSEVLTEGLRARLEAALGGRICDVYGSTEFKEVAWQCPRGRYHVNFESVWVEPLPTDRAAPLVISTLANRAMPLLRFRIGDEAQGAKGPCACGRCSPGLHSIQGRQADIITLPRGRRLSPYLLTTVIEQDPALVQYRIVETAPGEFRVELVGEPEPGGRADDALGAALRELTDGEGRFEVVRVARLERARSGKRSVFLRERSEL
jgi:phenylacetate-CoA ligase